MNKFFNQIVGKTFQEHHGLLDRGHLYGSMLW